MATEVPRPGSIVDNLLATLGAAANIGVPADNAEAQTGQAERALKAADAEAKFPANEEDSAAQLRGLTQLASGVAAAVAGALGGALQPLSQASQQAAQAGQQALQLGMGGLQEADTDVLPDETLGGDADGFFDGSGGTGTDGSGGGGFEGTTPAAVLGPPPAPSAATTPASSPTMPTRPGAPETAAAPRAGMGAMPMVPPGAVPATSRSASDPKVDAKRVVVPSVRNGAPVQGRITAAAPEVTKRLAGKPVTTRRVVVADAASDDAG
ncbi:hypothetical protein A5707_03200 [Mycobacterium kyorinense]|uniref:Uncharacterized protein n=2 Tax=Mycobacterium kyorinense TaxID=487514 RepID=A0A1A2Z214_9MYCO|nr:hypothetical protein A5707_03200 [Mycobacterium kyorinense]